MAMRPAEAEDKQAEVLRKLGGSKCLELAFELNKLVEELSKAGQRERGFHFGTRKPPKRNSRRT